MTEREMEDARRSRKPPPGDYGAAVIHNEGTHCFTRVMPGRVLVMLRRVRVGGREVELRIEVTPEVARKIGAELFADASKAEELAEESARWDLKRT